MKTTLLPAALVSAFSLAGILAVPRLACATDYESIARHMDSLTELQRDSALKSYEGGTVSGSGEVLNVGKCGWTTKSKMHGSDCLYVEVKNDSSNAKAYLYFPKSRESSLVSLSKGTGFRFSGCTIEKVQHWGFWVTTEASCS